MIDKTMTPAAPDSPETLDLCCNSKKCPFFEDVGDAIVITDVQAGATPVRIEKDRLSEVIDWLEKRRVR